MRDRSPPSPETLAALGLSGAALEAFASGLVNESWLVTAGDGARCVLQRVNAIFPPAINDDIDAVTRHLAAKGLVTPRLMPLRGGKRWLELDGAVWRLMSYVPGVTYERLHNAKQAYQAGALLGRFHAGLSSLDHEFANARLGVHDTAQHLARLEGTLETHADHRSHADARKLANGILVLGAELPALPAAPDRAVHGDPKLSNIVFDPDGVEALCLIDLDTLARMPLVLELGDALRSWCNIEGEDDPGARFSIVAGQAALFGYAETSRDFISIAEWQAIPVGVLTIAVELAARFCADALNERYFAWDQSRYGSCSEHNLARAAAQLALATDIHHQWSALSAATAEAFDF
jgi:Ser/Thr protein kinase RdoA (MazF antagonist)